jgi:hypothetical protein
MPPPVRAACATCCIVHLVLQWRLTVLVLETKQALTRELSVRGRTALFRSRSISEGTERRRSYITLSFVHLQNWSASDESRYVHPRPIEGRISALPTQDSEARKVLLASFWHQQQTCPQNRRRRLVSANHLLPHGTDIDLGSSHVPAEISFGTMALLLWLALLQKQQPVACRFALLPRQCSAHYARRPSNIDVLRHLRLLSEHFPIFGNRLELYMLPHTCGFACGERARFIVVGCWTLSMLLMLTSFELFASM